MESGRLGNAEWLPPAVFADRCPYEEGTFWVGRSPETGESLGYIDDRHIFLASGTRAGKGTTTIINNLCVWPGSVVVVDPKGENATVTAARRGTGSDYCEGMGQTVHVLDPFRVSDVSDTYRSRYNPLAEINPSDPKALRLTSKIADAIVVEHKNIKEPFWQDSARKMIKGIILHVLTSPRYEGRRNLVTVRQLINRGDAEGAEMLRAAGKKGVPSGHDLLWEGMSVNEAVNGVIAGIGEQMANLINVDAKLFHGMLQSVDRETEWLDDEDIQKGLAESDFSLADLKRDPNGVSVYLCMPEGDMTDYNRWVRMMLTLVIRVVEHQKERPACGHRILMVMDEFLALDRIKAVERAASYIAGFHLTMLFIVQGFSTLPDIYGKGWENIIGNCGLKIFFAVDEPFAREYISKMIGDTEVRPEVHTEGTGVSTNKARSQSTSESDTDSQSTSRSTGNTRSQSTTDSTSHTDSRTESSTSSRGMSQSHSRNRSRTDSVNESRADTRGSSQAHSKSSTLGWNDSVTVGSNWGQSRSHTDGEGSSEGGSWSPRKLFFRNTDDWSHLLRENETRNSGTNRSSSDTVGTNRGGSQSNTRGRSGSSSEGVTSSHNQSRTNTQGRGRSHTDGESSSVTFNQSESDSQSVGASDTRSRSSTQSQSQSVTDTVGQTTAHTTGRSQSETAGTSNNQHQSVSESVHARRLVPAEDIGRFFDRPAPGQIGFALVILGGGHPTVVVRAPYYNDLFFGWLFDPHPDHQLPPTLVGHERFALPSGGVEAGLHGRVQHVKRPGELIQRGELIAELVEPASDLDDINELYEERAQRASPADFGLPDPVPADIRLPVFAQIEGKVVEHVQTDNGWHQAGDDFVVIEVNRRKLCLDRRPDGADAVARYGGYLSARKQQERDGYRVYLSEQEALAKAELERVQDAKNELDGRLVSSRAHFEKNIEQDKEQQASAVIKAEQRYKDTVPGWFNGSLGFWCVAAPTLIGGLAAGGTIFLWMSDANIWARLLGGLVAGFVALCILVSFIGDKIWLGFVGGIIRKRQSYRWDDLSQSDRDKETIRTLEDWGRSPTRVRQDRAKHLEVIEQLEREQDELGAEIHRARRKYRELRAQGLREARSLNNDTREGVGMP